MSSQESKSGLQVEVVSESEDKRDVVLRLKQAKTEMVNALRRCCAEYVQTMAIARLDVVRNTSLFADRDLLDRLKLVPILCPAAAKERSCRCKDREYCSKCSCEFTLEVENKSSAKMEVTHADLVSTNNSMARVVEYKPPIRLFVLGANQVIHLTAIGLVTVLLL